MTTLIEARRAALARLATAGIVEPAQDVALLLARTLGVDRAGLALLSPQTALTADQSESFERAVAARAARHPMSHITGQRVFWGRSFSVTPAVLDPRPETETLIQAALDVPFHSVLDLGTGSGCILLTLLSERPTALGVGVDLSNAALDVARRNAVALKVQADFRLGSWFEPVQGRYDLIVSNPPYIAESEMADLSPEVRQYEPHLALTPGGDGLAAYRVLCAAAPRYLNAGGRFMVEIGPTQAAAVSTFFAEAGFEDIQILHDLDGRDRVVSAQLSTAHHGATIANRP